MKGYYRQVINELEAAGYTLVRYGKGDHQVWDKPGSKRPIVVDRGGGVASYGQRHHEAGRPDEALLVS